jgi:ABC-type transporter Mla subunit MlaD
MAMPARPRTKKTSPAPRKSRAAGTTTAVPDLTQELLRALAELPKPADFQPLADHLYTFAQHAPALLQSLQQIPQLTGPLQEICDSLHTLQAGLSEALLRMPRPEEYEPLAGPLREFARVSPALAESLSGLPRLAGVLAAASERLERASERLESPASAPSTVSAVSAESTARLQDAAADLEEVRRTLLTALGTLPREDDYAPVARQLRELASVSPSLLEWLKEVPKAAAPLADSIAALREAAERVAAARAAVLAASADRPPA